MKVLKFIPILILIFLIGSILLFIGCNTNTTYCPNFTIKSKVINKITDSNDLSTYKTIEVTGKKDSHKFLGIFHAPYEFASLGDCISYDQGVIKKVSCE